MLVVGVRAAGVRVGSDPLQEWSRHLEVVVRGVETLGAYTVVTVTPVHAGVTADRLYTTVPPTRRPVLGERCTVTIDMRQSFVFDAGTGQRLSSMLDSHA
jgi:hypothetical protein